MDKQTRLFLGLVVAGAIILAGNTLILIRCQKENVRPPLVLKEGLYQFGDIIVDTIGGEIRFDAKVQKRKGWVQHLIYLHGYRWLKEESAIISDARLADLQKAIALLDWRLWDELWHGKASNQLPVTSNQKKVETTPRLRSGQGNQLPVAREKKLALFIKWDGKEILAQELVVVEDKLGIGDFIFLGSPYFDHTALRAHKDINCRYCPMFPLEERALRKKFIRGSNQSGYELNSPLFPSKETEVTIIIRGG